MVLAFSVKTSYLTAPPLVFLCDLLCVFLGGECVCASQLERRLFILLVMKEGPPGALGNGLGGL